MNSRENFKKIFRWLALHYDRDVESAVFALERSIDNSVPVDVIESLSPGDVVPIMRRITEIKNGTVYFSSDDGKPAYGRCQDIRDGLKGRINFGELYEQYKPQVIPQTAKEWADKIAKRFGCINDTATLENVIRTIQEQAMHIPLRAGVDSVEPPLGNGYIW